MSKLRFRIHESQNVGKKLERYYTKNHRLEGMPVPQSIAEFLSEPCEEIWFSKARDLNLILSVKTAGRVLDVGCASGTLLWLAKQKWFEVKGVEIGRGPAEFARNVLGIGVYCGQLEDANFGKREFDIVAMIHAVEHVPNPRQMVRDIYRILKDDGVLIVVVPNFASWSSEKDGASRKWLQPENYYSHFTPQAIARVVERESFVPMVSSEEGRYNEEDIRALYGPEHIRTILTEVRRSGIMLVARKKSSPGSEQLAD